LGISLAYSSQHGAIAPQTDSGLRRERSAYRTLTFPALSLAGHSRAPMTRCADALRRIRAPPKLSTKSSRISELRRPRRRRESRGLRADVEAVGRQRDAPVPRVLKRIYELDIPEGREIRDRELERGFRDDERMFNAALRHDEDLGRRVENHEVAVIEVPKLPPEKFAHEEQLLLIEPIPFGAVLAHTSAPRYSLCADGFERLRAGVHGGRMPGVCVNPRGGATAASESVLASWLPTCSANLSQPCHEAVAMQGANDPVEGNGFVYDLSGGESSVACDATGDAFRRSNCEALGRSVRQDPFSDQVQNPAAQRVAGWPRERWTFHGGPSIAFHARGVSAWNYVLMRP